MTWKHFVGSYKLIDERFWKTFIIDATEIVIFIVLSILFNVLSNAVSDKYLPGMRFDLNAMDLTTANPGAFLTSLVFLSLGYLLLFFFMASTLRYWAWGIIEKKTNWSKIWPFFGLKAIINALFIVFVIFVTWATKLYTVVTPSWLSFTGAILIVILIIKFLYLSMLASHYFIYEKRIGKVFSKIWALKSKPGTAMMLSLHLAIIFVAISIISLVLKPLPEAAQMLLSAFMLIFYFAWARVYSSDFAKKYLK